MSDYIVRKEGVVMKDKVVNTHLQVHRKNKQFIDHDHIKRLFNDYQKALPKGSLICMRVLTPAGLYTITEKGKLNLKTLEEYLDGKVKESAKFYDVSQVDITLTTPRNKKK